MCSLRMYNLLVEKCFKDCIDSFRRKDLDSNEEKVGLYLIVHIHKYILDPCNLQFTSTSSPSLVPLLVPPPEHFLVGPQ